MSAHHVRGILCLLVIGCGRSPAERPIAWPELGQSRVLLHEDGVENAYPRLSRDSSRILYQSNRSGRWQLYELDVRTSASRAITTTTSNETLPDWSPDGRALLYNGAEPGPGGQFDVYRIDMTTLVTTRLTETRQDETCARYAPDGTRMIVLRNDVTADDVVELASDGTARDITATPRVRDGWPTYSPDGRWIYYASMAKGPFSLYRVPAAGGTPEQLTFARAGEEHARPFVSVDGTLVAYNVRLGRAIDIVVLRVTA